MIPMLSSGTLTFLTFLVLATFVVLGSLSLRRHAKHIDKDIPWESEMTEEGRAAMEFERQTR